MSRHGLVSALALVTLLHHAAGASQLTLPERARAGNGRAENSMSLEFDAAPLPVLVNRADVIVHGKISQVATSLSPDQMIVVTRYTVEPIRILKERIPVRTAPKPQPTQPLVVRVPGGTVSDSRGVMTTIVDAYPTKERFSEGDEILFFLVGRPEGDFALAHGPSGGFRITDGAIHAMSHEMAERREDQPRQAANVLRDIEVALRKQ
jgi:hypothetical protein